MTCWDILKIEPTTSKLVIKKAYTGQLKLCNPEDKPDEFQALRKAYQAALRESRGLNTSELAVQPAAENVAEPAQSKTVFVDAAPNQDGSISRVEQLEPALHALYSNVEQRASIDAWRALFCEAVFWDVDVNKQVKETCIAFFGQNPLLPAAVLHYVDHSLNFSTEYTQWSKSRVGEQAAWLVSSLNTAHLRFDYAPLDHYRGSFDELYKHLVLRRQIEDECIYDQANTAKIESLLAQREASFQFDVLLDECLAKQLWQQGQLGAARELLERLLAQAPTVKNQLMLADLLLSKTEYAGAHALYRSVLALEQHNLAAQKGNALCFYHEPQYEVAINLLEELCVHAFDDIRLKTSLALARAEHLKSLDARASDRNLVDRARLLLAMGRNQDCYDLVGEVPDPKTGIKRLFSSNNAEPEEIRLIRAAAVARLSYKPHAIELYGAVIDERIKRGENAVDVVKEMLIECNYKLVQEDLENYVVPNLQSLEQAAHANTLVDSEYWIAVALAHYKIAFALEMDDAQYQRHASAVLEATNRAVEVMPNQASYHLKRGYLLYGMRFYEQSIVSDEIASKTYLYDINIQKRIGRTYRKLKNYPAAVEAFGYAMSYAPHPDDQRDVNAAFAYLYHEMGDFPKALEHFLAYREQCDQSYLEDAFYLARLYYEYDQKRYKGQQFSQEARASQLAAIDECAQYNTYHRQNTELVSTFDQAIKIAQTSFPDELDSIRTRFDTLAEGA